MKKNTVLITGGAGFIGSCLCKNLIKNTNHNIVNIDKLTYAGDMKAINSIIKSERVNFIQGSIGNKTLIKSILKKHGPENIYNLAAETHVDNSISRPREFIRTNIMDTHTFLEIMLEYYSKLDDSKSKDFKFLQISTDEVYGDIKKLQRNQLENTL